MTAISAARQADRVHILSDGAAYDLDGAMSATMLKVIELPNASAAIAMSGQFVFRQSLISPLLKRCVVDYESFDAMIAELELICSPFSETGFIVGGISETRGPSIWYRNRDGSSFDYLDGEQWSYGHMPIPSPQTMIELGYRSPATAAEFDPARHGVTMMEGCRRTPFELHGTGLTLNAVGAFVAHTEISDEGVTTRIIHTWPDPIGEPIDPTRSAARPEAGRLH